MPRPTRSHGRPGTAVVPEGFGPDHAPVAEGSQTAWIVIRRPGDTQEWDEETEQMVTVPHDPTYTGGCRVQSRQTGSGRTVTVAADPEVTASYTIAVPVTATVAAGMVGLVTETDDPLLDGRTVIVRQLLHGSLLVERVLLCDLTDPVEV